MKTPKTITVAAAALLAVSAFSTQALVLDFASVPGGLIDFNGNSTFDIATTNSNPSSFDITSTGPSEGLDGYFQGGVFTIGTISNPFSGLYTANVTGSSTMYISDGDGHNLTGTIQWQTASTFETSGTLNFDGSANLTSLAYSGANSDLLALASAGNATVVVSFDFTSPMSLTQLATTVTSTSFSGSISASPVPEPGAWTLVGTGLTSLFCLNLLRRRK